jgi:uncharacterized protein (TIGR03067 family)
MDPNPAGATVSSLGGTHMRSFPWIAATCVWLAAAPAAPADDAPKGDLAKVQGKWRGMVGRDKNIPVVLAIKGNKVTVTATRPDDGQEVEIKGEIRINDKSSPKQWDWINFNNPMGEAVPDNLAIYELDGDMLKFCSGGPGNPRPTEFKAGEDGPPNLITVTRVKDDSKKDSK